MKNKIALCVVCGMLFVMGCAHDVTIKEDGAVSRTVQEIRNRVKHTPKIEKKVVFMPGEKKGEGFYFIVFKDVNLPGTENTNRNIGFFIVNKEEETVLQVIRPGYSFRPDKPK